MKNFFMGFGLSILILTAIMVFITMPKENDTKQKAPAIEAFLDQFYNEYNNQNFSYIYDNMVSQEYKNARNHGSNQEIFITQYNYLGNLIDRVRGNDIIADSNKTSRGRLYKITFKASFERGSTSNYFLLNEDQNGQFKIDEYRFHIYTPQN